MDAGLVEITARLARYRGKNSRKLTGESFHLTIGHLEKDMDAGHPLDKQGGILKGTTLLSCIQCSEIPIPASDEATGEIKLTTFNQAFIIVLQLRVSMCGCPHRLFFDMNG